jgi:hypothetical protein
MLIENRSARRSAGRRSGTDHRASFAARSVPLRRHRLGGPGHLRACGSAGDLFHKRTVAGLVEHVPRSEEFGIQVAGHRVHLSRPDAFADFVRRVVQLLGTSAGRSVSPLLSSGRRGPMTDKRWPEDRGSPSDPRRVTEVVVLPMEASA